MTNQNRDQLCVFPTADFDPVVARWIWQLADARRLTLEKLTGISDTTLLWRPDAEANAIGTLLYHIVLIELDWLYVEILERPDYISDAAIAMLLPYPDRDKTGRLTVIEGETVQAHLDRMAAARQLLYDALRPMAAEEFYRKRELENYDVTPEWVVYHLIQHETEHRGEIAELRRQAEFLCR